jgi:hypothetical protein
MASAAHPYSYILTRAGRRWLRSHQPLTRGSNIFASNTPIFSYEIVLAALIGQIFASISGRQNLEVLLNTCLMFTYLFLRTI